MTEKTCYLVIGGEGNGTYMLAEALVSSGCTYIQDGDDFIGDKIVVRRSLPHAGKWPDVVELVSDIESIGYEINFLHIYRKKKYAVQSVLRRDNARDRRDVKSNMVRADFYVSNFFGFVSSHVEYEDFVTSKVRRKTLFRSLGLPEPSMEFYNANEKYYGDDYD